MNKVKKILVVCTGNACRSPMAEGFLKERLKQEHDFVVLSAGISAVDGLAPTDAAIQVMKEDGIDISSYSTKSFSKVFANAADLVLVMSRAHKEFILNKMPGLKNKVFLYTEFANTTNSPGDIDDPIGQPISMYRHVRDQIKAASKEIAGKIRGGL